MRPRQRLSASQGKTIRIQNPEDKVPKLGESASLFPNADVGVQEPIIDITKIEKTHVKQSDAPKTVEHPKQPTSTTPTAPDVPKGNTGNVVKEAVGEGTKSLGKLSKWKGAGMVAGALALGGLALNAASNRGQLSNAQLYGQRPLY